ncbi:hypothetical protein D3C77_805210 [compost metagenome]
MPDTPYSAPANWPAVAATLSASSARLAARRIASLKLSVFHTAHSAASKVSIT